MPNEPMLGALPSGWRYTTLAEACALGGGSIQTGPFGSQLHKSDYVSEGVPSIMPTNIGDNRINTDGIARVKPADAQRLSRYLVREGDIVYSRRGDVEKRALIREPEDGWLCGTGCLRVRLGSEGPDPQYTSYYLGHPAVRAWIVRHAHGATMPNLNTSILGALPLIVPPRTEQKRIAEMLGRLDDKIELNRRMRETLDAIAQSVFHDWFVDFGPTRAQVEGRSPYLAQHLWRLFPNTLDSSGFPSGWALKDIRDVAKVTGGKQLSKEFIASRGRIPVFGGAGIMGYTEGSKNADGFVITIGRVGAYCGRFFYHRGPAWINNNASLITPNKNVAPEWLLHVLRTLDLDPIRKGAAQPFISNGDLLRLQFVHPGPDLIAAFQDTTSSLFRRAEVAERESSILSEAKDAILPKLISGELRVPEAEQLVSEVA